MLRQPRESGDGSRAANAASISRSHGVRARAATLAMHTTGPEDRARRRCQLGGGEARGRRTDPGHHPSPSAASEPGCVDGQPTRRRSMVRGCDSRTPCRVRLLRHRSWLRGHLRTLTCQIHLAPAPTLDPRQPVWSKRPIRTPPDNDTASMVVVSSALGRGETSSCHETMMRCCTTRSVTRTRRRDERIPGSKLRSRMRSATGSCCSTLAQARGTMSHSILSWQPSHRQR